MNNDLLNDDWLRTMRWDVFDNNELVTTLDAFISFLGADHKTDAEKRDAVRQATELPFYIPAPESLKQEVEAFLAVKKSISFSPTISLD